MSVLNRLPGILLTLGLVAWFQEIFSIEWSFPYCSDQADGPASAVWGMPFPYIRWSTVSSMEYFWMPAVFILNIAVLFAIAYPFVSWVVRWIDQKALLLTKEEYGFQPGGGSLSRDERGENHPVGRDGRHPSFVRRGALLVVGLFLVVAFGTWTVLLIQSGVYKIPVSNIAHDNYESYTDFRPVRFGFKTLRYDCTPLSK